jgi:hypothetical protein
MERSVSEQGVARVSFILLALGCMVLFAGGVLGGCRVLRRIRGRGIH